MGGTSSMVSRQSDKFLIGQSRKFLLTADGLKDGTNRDEPRGTGLAGVVEAGPRRSGDATVCVRANGGYGSMGPQAARQDERRRRWSGSPRTAREGVESADRRGGGTAGSEDYATAGVA